MARDGDESKGMTRREWAKLMVGGGVAAAAATGGFLIGRSLIQPFDPLVHIENSFLYTDPHADSPPWYVEGGLVGRPARLRHFDVGQGATAIWRVVFDADGEPFPGTGFPVVLVRFEEEEITFPTGYDRTEFVVDGLVALFNCCTHACCRTGWKLVPRDHIRDDLGFDTLFCPCHFVQYDPRTIAVDRHPDPPLASGAEYLGAQYLIGPTDRGLPLIPLEVEEDVLLGIPRYPEWYRYLDFRDREL